MTSNTAGTEALFDPPELAASHMARALELAERGRGWVEPNPLVGCVVVSASGEVVGEGDHTRFGAAHAEVEALALAGARAQGGTVFVTLEPCCHFGKTPPCTQALIAAKVAQVFVATRDPFPLVSGSGIDELRRAGIRVSVGLLESAAQQLNAPFFKLVQFKLPWMIAKWAMTLDGKLAAHTGDSRWISGEPARNVVHALRGRVDGVLIGWGTARADDPLLTARHGLKRVATRIVLDSNAQLSSDSQLARTAKQVPVLVVVGPTASAADCQRLERCGCEVLNLTQSDRNVRLQALLSELGQRQLTNILVEGGGQVLGALFDLCAIDEVHAFIAPKLIGGSGPAPLAGMGLPLMSHAARVDAEISQLGDDVYVRGAVSYLSTSAMSKQP
jgi:diaminohydroxyphosphoribosylaminopyrimidine deaminase/5-amino-6-(5-phosphoribosylamino)uracil reductase